MVRLRFWVVGRKSTEGKCHFHAMISWIHTVNVLYHCWCWPSSAGWGSASVFSTVNLLFFIPLSILSSLEGDHSAPFLNEWRKIELEQLILSSFQRKQLLNTDAASFTYSISLCSRRDTFLTPQVFTFQIWSTERAEWLTWNPKVSWEGVNPKPSTGPSQFSFQPQILTFEK